MVSRTSPDQGQTWNYVADSFYPGIPFIPAVSYLSQKITPHS